MSKQKRSRLFIDPGVQGAIVRRLLIYCLAAFVFVTSSLATVRTCQQPDRLFLRHVVDVWRDHAAVFAAALLTLPFLLYDTLKLSHRFAGPIYRLRNQLRPFDHGPIPPIKFRQDDFWSDLADQVSRLVERLQAAEKTETPRPPK